jgi:hypothetical protein
MKRTLPVPAPLSTIPCETEKSAFCRSTIQTRTIKLSTLTMLARSVTLDITLILGHNVQ